jgi:hypothetical protein
MSQQTQINQFLERKATQYPRLDLRNQVETRDRLDHFL